MFGEDHKAPNYSFLQSSVTSALGPHNLHSTHFLNTLRVCSASVKDQISHPYKTRDKLHFVSFNLNVVIKRRRYLSGLDSAGFDLSATSISVRLCVHELILRFTNSRLSITFLKSSFVRENIIQ
jgi:hypothetical protein